jgi:ferredoxin--NADP+ reductase
VRHLKATVTERRDITPTLWVVRVRPEETVVFTPGQYVTVALPMGEKLVERPYSVASAPHERELEFFLEVVPGGKLSPHLYDVPTGGEVYVRPTAKGRFTLAAETRSHFMAATVTGVAPFVSMVRSLAALEAQGIVMPSRITILHAASNSEELAYDRDLQSYASLHNWFHYVPTLSRIWTDPEWRGERGRIEDVIRKYLDAPEFARQATTVYLCGNPQMITNAEGILERAGYAKTNIRKENYWPAD